MFWVGVLFIAMTAYLTFTTLKESQISFRGQKVLTVRERVGIDFRGENLRLLPASIGIVRKVDAGVPELVLRTMRTWIHQNVVGRGGRGRYHILLWLVEDELKLTDLERLLFCTYHCWLSSHILFKGSL